MMVKNMKSKGKLGRLEMVDLREYWDHEARDFTPWLSEPENLALLSEQLDIELEVIRQEENIGPFRADILAKDASSGDVVVIENQLNQTDHSHLGQLITYAAGKKAKHIIWVSNEFDEEHRAALDWLNEITEKEIHFFGVQIELWKIGDSPIAPRFNLISSPNDWSKMAKDATDFKPTERDKVLLDFWTKFNERVKTSGSKIKTRKPQMQNWYDFGIGHSNYYISALVNLKNKWIAVILWIRGENRSQNFAKLKELYDDKAKAEISPDLVWDEKEGKNNCEVRLTIEKDPNDKSDWAGQIDLLIKNIERFETFFGPKVRQLEG